LRDTLKIAWERRKIPYKSVPCRPSHFNPGNSIIHKYWRGWTKTITKNPQQPTIKKYVVLHAMP